MVSVPSLWLPILLSAVIVFIVSSLIHMLMPYHRTDVQKVPGEDEVMDALRRQNIEPGNYAIPHAADNAARKDPTFIEKWTKGPTAFLTVVPSGPPNMGKQLTLWFVYCVVVGIFVAYIAGRALEPGAEYAAVFRFAGATAFIAYVVGSWPDAIWWGRKWSTVAKNTFDALIYALLTGGTFGGFWPDMM